MDQEKADSIEKAEVLMLRDLMNCVRDQAIALPKPWQQMSQTEQQDYLDSAESQIRTSVDECINIIACRDVPTVAGIVDKVVFKGGAQVVIKFPSVNQGVHDLADAEKHLVQIIIPANPDDLMDETDLPTGEVDQRGLELDSEHQDEN